MANEHSIRVSARGEFGQLERGLKNLQKDLGSVLGEINKGARKGGIFDDSQLRALDIFKDRFKSTMRELETEFTKQNDLIDKMHKQMESAQRSEKRRIQENIQLREKELDIIRRKMFAAEQNYARHTAEATDYGSGGGRSPLDADAINQASGGKSLLERLIRRTAGFSKGALGLAGIGGVGAVLSEAYQQAYMRSIGSMDLAQRVRGSAGYAGSATEIHDRMRDVGLRNNLGFSSEQVMTVQDVYSSQAGALSTSGLEKMLTFARGYGVDESQMASMLGENIRLAGNASPDAMADAITQSIEQSGMVARIVEVMETNNALTAQLAHTFNNYESETYLGYQTILDTLGMQRGMNGLTGAAGGDVLSGLGGIYGGQEGNKWKWMGIQALQAYNPEKYGGMNLYQLESAFEDGLANTDNLPAMAQLLRKEAGGNQELFDRTIQAWLMEGGFQATKRQASELSDVTGNFTVFDAGKVNAVIGQNANGDATAKYNEERVGEEGQRILQVEAEWQKNLEQVGEDFLGVITSLKGSVGELVQELDQFTDVTGDIIEGLLDRFEEATGVDLSRIMEMLSTPLGILSTVAAVKLFDTVRNRQNDKRGGDASTNKDDKDPKKPQPSATDKDDKTEQSAKDFYDTDDTDSKDTKDAKGKRSSLPDVLRYGGPLGIFFGALAVADEVASNAEARRDLGETPSVALTRGGMDALWDNILGVRDESLFEVNATRQQQEKNAISEVAHELELLRMSYEHGLDTRLPMARNAQDGKAIRSDYNKEFAQNLWDNGLQNALGIEDKTSGEGLREAVQVFKAMGITTEELPKAMQTALTRANMDYSQTGTVSAETLALAVKNIEELEVVPNHVRDMAAAVHTGVDAGKTSLTKLASEGTFAVDGLSTAGRYALEKLQEEGVLRLTDMNTSSAATLLSFSETGQSRLLALQEQGLIRIGGLQSDGTAKITALSEAGKTALTHLDETGTIKLADFDEKGRLLITDLSEKGLEHLLNLESNGSISLVGMSKTTGTRLEEMREHTHKRMDEIKTEHRTMGQLFHATFSEWSWSDLVDNVTGFFGNLFKDWTWDNFKRLLPFGWGGGDTGNSAYGVSDVTAGIKSVSAAQLNNKLGGALSGYGSQFVAAGQKYGINPAVLAAISMHETGNGTSHAARSLNNVGGMMGRNGLMSFGSIEKGIEAMASNLKRLYIDQGLVTIEAIQKKYAPEGASNDPNGLNKYWVSGVKNQLNVLGASNVGVVGNNNDFWSGWSKRITSGWGDARGNRVHQGLDVDGDQGDPIPALVGGVIDKIKMDDGGRYDRDGRANSTLGGTEIVVRMPNGEKYFYSHLSKVAPDLLESYFAGKTTQVEAGQILGLMGGEKGVAGSGTSTTGSHLHMGYINKSGKLTDPLQLMRKLGLFGSGDSDYGLHEGETQGATTDDILTDLLHKVLNAYTHTQPTNQPTETSSRTVNLNHKVTLAVDGAGAQLLNQSTIEQLKRLVVQVVADKEALRLAMNPTRRG